MIRKNNPQEFRLRPTETDQWQKNGYFIRHDQFAAQEIAEFQRAAKQATIHAQQAKSGGKTYFLDHKRFVDTQSATLQYEHYADAQELRVLEPVHHFQQTLEALVDDPRLVSPMQGLIGQQKLALWTTKLNLKPAGGSGFGWHQDSPYWMHNCEHVDRLPNVMITLDPQHETNGCLRIISGSHKRGILPGTNDGTSLGGFFTNPANFDLDEQRAMVVDSGACIFFSPHAVHGSDANPSAQSRRALIFTYQPGNHPMLKNGQIRNVN